jgi:hypothetical protein
MTEATAQAAINQETLGGHGDPCAECGAPLASDQRYCVNCGARRAAPRVDYRTYMQRTAGGGAPPRQAAPAASGKADEPERPQRDYTPLAAVGGIAILGLMLLIGVLIGKGGGDTGSTPPAVVVKPSTGQGSETASEGGGAASTGTAKHAAGAGRSKGRGGSGEAGGPAPAEASDQALNELESQSGEDYVEQSKKIPDEVVTPGKPPPIDKSKPPGGGEGGGLVIK